ncbi:hypothetical protein BpHYR1_020926 [Brachionus plicatilis]|uniref:Uncharacterized protein n=1 Tax=Brachionus plicatilis TaxID=10195 RepID=A0A3M7RQL8_BRAPC|nr:hypothetical protein BpHYR1_020926 [Brachionus plicatilis]
MAFGADSRDISEEEIKKMVDNQHFEAQSEFSNLVNLYKKKNRSGFFGIKIGKIGQLYWFESTNGKDFCFKNLMIYGSTRSGIRSVMNTILRTKLNNTLNQKKKKNCQCYVKKYETIARNKITK